MLDQNLKNQNEQEASDAVASVQPPYSNRGVNFFAESSKKEQATEKTKENVICKFDWYQATVDADPAQIEADFLTAFGGVFEDATAHQGYEKCRTHQVMRFTISWGGQHSRPNIRATSYRADQVSRWIRSRYPNHRVSRADVCFDFVEATFDQLKEVIDSVASPRVTRSFVGNLDENDLSYPWDMRKGRTHYFGSHQSDLMILLYEKGLEMRSKGHPNVNEKLVRLEVRVRPQKERKADAAHLEPFEMIGFSRWISTAIGKILDDTPTVLPDYAKMEKDPLDSLRHMAWQYSGQIQAFLDGKDQNDQRRSWQQFVAFVAQHMPPPGSR